MLRHILSGKKSLLLVLNLMLLGMITSLLCLGCWFNLSLLPPLLLPRKYILYSHLSMIPYCGCTILCSVFFSIIQKNIAGSFLVCLYIYITLEACMYVCLFIVVSNISIGWLSIFDILTLEAPDHLQYNPRFLFLGYIHLHIPLLKSSHYHI